MLTGGYAEYPPVISTITKCILFSLCRVRSDWDEVGDCRTRKGYKMNTIHLKGSWYINASRAEVYDIVSDFERMPERFPKVAHSMKIVKRNGDRLEIDAVAKSFGKQIPVKINATLLPQNGYITDTVNSTFKTTGHEKLLLEDDGAGTRINYSYEYDISKADFFLRIIAKPLFDWFSMWYWERAFVNVLRKFTEGS